MYTVRETGRLGNILFEYFFWRLLSMSNRQTFVNKLNVDEFGKVTKSKTPSFPKPFSGLINFIPAKDQLQLVPKLNVTNIPEYPMSFKYFCKYRDLLRNMIIPKRVDVDQMYDIAIHIRLDNDVFNKDEPLYTILPLSFYRDVIVNLQTLHGSLEKCRIVVIGRPLTDIQSKIIDDVYNYVVKLTGSKNVVLQSGTISEDMLAIMNSRILVCAVSSFWFWPSYLSLVNNEIHCPMFGQCKAYQFDKYTSPTYRVYRYDTKLTKKIDLEHVHMMYTPDYELEFNRNPIVVSQVNYQPSMVVPVHENTKKVMKQYSVIIAGTCRDNEEYIKKTLAIFDKIGGQFKDYIVIIYENDSTDKTRDILLKNKKKNYTYIFEDNVDIKERTQRIAYCRNKILKNVDRIRQNYDYLIMADMDDVINKGTIVNTINTCFKYPENRWSVMTANQKYEYYDVWALRVPGVLETDCWIDVAKDRKRGVSEGQAEQRRIVKFQNPIPRVGLVEVNSAFSVVAVYRLKDIGGCTYNGLRENKSMVCEHVPFHECIRNRGHKVFINTEMYTD